MIHGTKRPIRGLAVALLLFAVAGCSKSSGTGNRNVQVGDSTPKQGGGQPGAKGNRPPPQEFVGNFIKALGEGKASPDVFTVAFKHTIARPRPGNEDDKRLGFNPVAVEAFLKKASLGKYDTLTLAESKVGPVFRGIVMLNAGSQEVCVIRLAPAEGDEGWRIAWFHRTGVYPKGIPVIEELTADNGGGWLAAYTFLENLLGGELVLAEAVLAKAWKVREYGSENPSDADLGYNQALVLQRLKSWRNGFTEFTIARRATDGGKTVTFEGQLIEPGKTERKTYSLKVAKHDSGEWFVEDFAIK
jgi:hypothetical protein